MANLSGDVVEDGKGRDQDSVEPRTADFAPADYSDGRVAGEWATQYPRDATKAMYIEAAYLVFLLAISIFLMVAIWLGTPQRWLEMPPSSATTLTRYSVAFLSGTVGGALISIKWLYHTIPKKLWHQDRRWWRYLMPIVAGGLGFAFVVIAHSRLFGVFDPGLVHSTARASAVALLVGLFSDSAMAKLTEIAESLFGPTKRANEKPSRRKKRDG
jgi:hypothetical protein